MVAALTYLARATVQDGPHRVPAPKSQQMFAVHHGNILIEATSKQAKWLALLGEIWSWRTNQTREVRHKALQVAQSRVQTVLNRLMPKDTLAAEDELVAALERAGL